MLLFAIAVGVGAFQFFSVVKAGIFKQRGDGVESEACNTPVEPEANGVKHGFLYSRVAPV